MWTAPAFEHSKLDRSHRLPFHYKVATGMIMNKRLLEIIGTVVSVGLFCAALFIIHRLLQQHHLREIAAEFASLSWYQIALALMFTALSYLALSGYDMLALRYVRHPLPYPRVLVTSFTTYAIGHNLGFSLFTGGSLRYRIYGAWGLSVFEITSLMGFGVTTFWLGYLTTSAVVLVAAPLAVPPQISLPFASSFPLGLLFAVVLLAYLTWILILKKPLQFRGWRAEVPSPRLTVSQICIGVFDWSVAATALYVLLPASASLSYVHVLGIFLLAQIAGLASNVPGGLGVFESVFLILAGAVGAPATIIGSLLAFRIVYYITPLFMAAISLAVLELRLRKGLIRKNLRIIQQVTSLFVPHLMALLIFVTGAMLLFSGATPAVSQRMEFLQDILPLPAIEISHFMGSIIGLGLLVLARSLQRRLDGAYVLSLVFLSVGIVVSLAKGFDYEEATVLFAMLLILLPSRSFFYRRSSLLGRPLSPTWVVAIVIVVACSLWLSYFSFRHVDYSQEMLWQFELAADAPRSLRAGVAVGGVALLIALRMLLRPFPRMPVPPTEEELDTIFPVVKQSGRTQGYLALLGDKALLESASGRSFVMYSVAGRSWVSMGDPVGDPSEFRELVWQFREIADRHGGWTVFYQISNENLPLYLDVGLNLLKLGEEARVSLADFTLEGHENKQLRHWRRHPQNEGCTFELLSADEAAPLIPQLRDISDQWLRNKNTREKGFSLGFFDESYIRRTPVAIVKQKGVLVAFANVWPGDNHEELSVDLMRHTPEAIAGVMDYMFIEMMLWGQAQGYRWFNLGMAPLAGLESPAPGPFWNQLGTFIYRHGEHFYNFRGLRQYKEKFRPVWEPRFLACPGGLAVYRVLTNVATMISGGLTGVVSK